MRWRSVFTPSTPVVAVVCLGVLMGLAWLSKPTPRVRLSKGEKRELRRQSRKRGRSSNSKRAGSRRRESRAQLVKQIGIEEFKKLVDSDKRQKEEQRERLQAAMDNPNSLQLVVDLNWAESLSDKELSSLRKQLCYVYGRVKASLTPPALTLTSYQGRAAEVMQSAGAGFWLASRNPLGVFELFDRRKVVYLSPDSEEVLEDVVSTEVYVVGGIVDRNVSRGLTLAAAEGGKARAVRLPFDEYLPEVSSQDQVLTVCACVGVLMSRHAGGEWKEVLEKSVPQRGKGYTGSRKKRGGAWRGADATGWGVSGWGRPAEIKVKEEDGVGDVEGSTSVDTND